MAAAILAVWIVVRVLIVGLVGWMHPAVLGIALAMGWLATKRLV